MIYEVYDDRTIKKQRRGEVITRVIGKRERGGPVVLVLSVGDGGSINCLDYCMYYTRKIMR